MHFVWMRQVKPKFVWNLYKIQELVDGQKVGLNFSQEYKNTYRLFLIMVDRYLMCSRMKYVYKTQTCSLLAYSIGNWIGLPDPPQCVIRACIWMYTRKFFGRKALFFCFSWQRWPNIKKVSAVFLHSGLTSFRKFTLFVPIFLRNSNFGPKNKKPCSIMFCLYLLELRKIWKITVAKDFIWLCHVISDLVLRATCLAVHLVVLETCNALFLFLLFFY